MENKREEERSGLHDWCGSQRCRTAWVNISQFLFPVHFLLCFSAFCWSLFSLSLCPSNPITSIFCRLLQPVIFTSNQNVTTCTMVEHSYKNLGNMGTCLRMKFPSPPPPPPFPLLIGKENKRKRIVSLEIWISLAVSVCRRWIKSHNICLSNCLFSFD